MTDAFQVSVWHQDTHVLDRFVLMVFAAGLEPTAGGLYSRRI